MPARAREGGLGCCSSSLVRRVRRGHHNELLCCHVLLALPAWAICIC